jgi:hypothetical protein
MDAIGRIQLLPECAVGLNELAPEIEQSNLGILVELLDIEGRVGLANILVKAIPRCVGRENLGDHDLRPGKSFTQIPYTQGDPPGGRLDARLGGEKHIVVADHQDDETRLQSLDSAMIEPPQHVLRLVSPNANVHRLEFREMTLPGIAPLNSDAVTDQQDIKGAPTAMYRPHMRIVQFQPGITAKMPRTWDHGPEVWKVFFRLFSWAAFEFGLLDNEGPLLGGQRPSRLLRLVRLIGIVDSHSGHWEADSAQEQVTESFQHRWCSCASDGIRNDKRLIDQHCLYTTKGQVRKHSTSASPIS